MELGLYNGARICYERLQTDFSEVKNLVESGDLEKACNIWKFALLNSQHLGFGPYIASTIFGGISFNAYANMLRDRLEEKNRHGIDFCIKGISVMIAQEKLRTKSLARNEETS